MHPHGCEMQALIEMISISKLMSPPPTHTHTYTIESSNYIQKDRMTFRGAVTTAKRIREANSLWRIYYRDDVHRMQDDVLRILCELIPQALRLRLLPSIVLHADISRIHDQIHSARCLIWHKATHMNTERNG